MIRPATPDDLDTLCSLGERFTTESALPLKWAPDVARQTFWNMLHNPEVLLLVYDAEGVVAGMVMGMVERDFFVQSSAYVHKLFVEKEFRGLGVSRDLVAGFEKEAREQGAGIVFASATAGMGERVERLYVNLFKGCGYEVLGRVLVKGF